LFTIAMGGWVLSIAGVESNQHIEAWGRFSFVSASFISPTFLAFSRFFPIASDWPSKRLIVGALAWSTLLAVLSATTRLVAYDITQTPDGIQRSSGILYPIYAISIVACAVVSLSVFIAKSRLVRGLAKAQLQYLGIGLLVVSAGGITANLLIPIATGRSSYSWLGPYFSLPLVLLVGHAIIRHRLMDLRLVINRGLTYLLTTAIVSLVVIAFSKIILFPLQSMPIPHDVLIVVIVSLLLLSVPGQSIIARLVDPYLYRRRLDHPLALRQATHRLSRLMQPSELARELRDTLSSAFVPESFAMVVRSSEGQDLEPLISDFELNPTLRETLRSLVSEDASSALVVSPTRDSRTPAHGLMRDAGIELVVPLGRRGQLLGAILLGPRKSGDAYFAADLTFIESLADLASIALENSLLYRQRIQMLEYSDRLLEALDSAVIAIDVDGRITSFNSAAKSLLGLAERDRGHHVDLLPSQVSWALALAVTGAWRPLEAEAVVDHPTRGPLPVILSTAVLHDESEKVSGALVVVTDLSTIKALERNQRRIEHLATMARFYAGIAHEIRSPLAAISNFIAMLPDRFDDPEYRDTAARLLPMEVGRIVRLAERLRLMAPSEGGKLTEIALPPLLADIIAIHGPTAEDAGTRVALNCPREIPKIIGDPGQLVQLFVNLLRNAAESMPTGGIISIDATHTFGLGGEGRVIVRVIDDGLGIDPSVRGRIFEPFFTTKPSGTGLGLSICQEIADFHRARLTLSPRLGHIGTIAEIEFPSLEPDLSDRVIRPLAPQPQASYKR
jgi:signal transduction histidine kinase